jgi:phosphinothricin acetyltransferase
MDQLQIRDATEADQSGILSIYNDAVLHTTAVWNETPRSWEDQREWFRSKQAQTLPVLVAARAEEIAGFCSYGPFRPWYGYRFTVENSIYVATSFRRQGLARQMLDALIDRARSQGLHMMVAGIEAQNAPSVHLHEQAGFTVAAHLHEVGFKFGRWLDLVLMERRL